MDPKALRNAVLLEVLEATVALFGRDKPVECDLRQVDDAVAARLAKSLNAGLAKGEGHSRHEAQRAREILEGKPASRDIAAQSYFVQLGVFRDEANAREVMSRASASGVKAAGVKADDKTRVRAGPFSDRAMADAAVAKLKKAGLNGIVTSK